MSLRIVFPLIFLLLLKYSVTYRPVAIVHGIMFTPGDHMEYLRTQIEDSQATSVSILEMLYDEQSFLPMWHQVHEFREEIIKLSDANPDGINVIGYSQGGLIARGVIETIPNHTVRTFVSLSSPQNGFHGEFFVPKSAFSVGNEEKFSDSVAGFWKDPRDMIRYKQEGRFLATLNNEIRHEKNQAFKDAMCRLNRLVLIGGPDDGVVVPWESSQFGFDNPNGQIIPMTGQKIYQDDSICLKTLNERGAITIHTVPGVRHPEWHNNDTIIKNYILPHLV